MLRSIVHKEAYKPKKLMSNPRVCFDVAVSATPDTAAIMQMQIHARAQENMRMRMHAAARRYAFATSVRAIYTQSFFVVTGCTRSRSINQR